MDQMELRLSARRAIADLSRMVAALRRAELMAKEIDHRVMNSLQLVSGLLNVQSRGVGSSEAAEQLALASHRVTAIAQVHRQRRRRQGELQGLFERLCAELSSTLWSAESDAIAVVSDEVEIPTEQIVPLGLIVNELVTNSVKHGGAGLRYHLNGKRPKGMCWP